MTREEAIEILESIDNADEMDEEFAEAYNKAIKALEQNTKYRKEAKRWKNKALGQKQVLDKIREEIEDKSKRLSNADTINGLCGAVALIFDEQSIIEANKESEDKE